MQRLLLCRTGWMRSYRGLKADALKGSSAYIKKYGTGHEIYNFQRSGNRMFGYVQYEGSLHLSRIDPTAGDADYLDGVTVVWAAPHPRGGVYVVGWYLNATVHSTMRQTPNSAKRVDPQNSSKLCWWSIETKATNAHLVPEDARWLRVPREFALRSYVRYVDDESMPAKKFRAAIAQYIGGGWSKQSLKVGKSGGYQADVAKRIKIEEAAMRCVADHYASMHFVVKAVPSEKKGWDLEAQRGALLLRIEVKGCSGADAIAELTPNEYAKSLAHQDSYRVCLVTRALTDPTLRVFQWTPEVGQWTGDDGATLSIEEKTGARVWVE